MSSSCSLLIVRRLDDSYIEPKILVTIEIVVVPSLASDSGEHLQGRVASEFQQRCWACEIQTVGVEQLEDVFILINCVGSAGKR